jgi:uncharacterized protein
LSLVFADTSALVKRYVPETGSTWVESWFAPASGTIVAISELAILEILSALARRYREGSIPAAVFAQLQIDVRFHARWVYLVIPLEGTIIAAAGDLILRHPLRSLDAIHLASAQIGAQLLGATPTFVSADGRLLAAATAEGFPTDDPNLH